MVDSTGHQQGEGVDELLDSLGLNELPNEVTTTAPVDAEPGNRRPAGNLWAFVAGALAVGLLTALAAVIWLVATDDGGSTTATEATDVESSTTEAPAAQSSDASEPASSLQARPEGDDAESPYQTEEGDGPAEGQELPPPGQAPPPRGDGRPPPPPGPGADQATRDRLQQELDRVLTDTPIVFDAGSSELSELQTAFVETTIAGLLRSYPGSPVLIVGYSDLAGEEDANQLLSIERARAVEAALLRVGIPEFAFTVEGRGETDTADHAGNERRVEFEVLPE